MKCADSFGSCQVPWKASVQSPDGSLGVQDWLWTVAKEDCNPSHDCFRSRSQYQDLGAQMSLSPTSYLGGLELSLGPFQDLQGCR